MTFEEYELIFSRYWRDGAERTRIDEPIVVRCSLQVDKGASIPIVLNSMIERMREYILDKAGGIDMDDLISRQAEIDAFNRAVTKEAARWSVEELPSAEMAEREQRLIDMENAVDKNYKRDNYMAQTVKSIFETDDKKEE